MFFGTGGAVIQGRRDSVKTTASPVMRKASSCPVTTNPGYGVEPPSQRLIERAEARDRISKSDCCGESGFSVSGCDLACSCDCSASYFLVLSVTPPTWCSLLCSPAFPFAYIALCRSHSNAMQI